MESFEDRKNQELTSALQDFTDQHEKTLNTFEDLNEKLQLQKNNIDQLESDLSEAATALADLYSQLNDKEDTE